MNGFGNGNFRNQGPQQMQMKINLNELEEHHCDNCDGSLFAQAFNIRLLPALMSPNGQPGFAHINIGFVCVSCGRLYTTQELTQLVNKPNENGNENGNENENKTTKIIDVTSNKEEPKGENNDNS